MKIGFLIQNLSWGGAERAASSIASALAQRGAEVQIITFGDEDRFYSPSNDVKVVNMDFSKIPRELSFKRIVCCAKRFKQIRKYIKKEKFDVLVCMSNTMTVYGVFASMFTKTKSVGTERNNPYKYASGKISTVLRKVSAFFANGFVFQTKAAAEFFPNRAQKRGEVIPNAVFNKLVYELPQTQERQNIIYGMGRLTEAKRFDLLIDAFAEVSKKHKDTKLIIFGEGDDREKLQSQIDSLSLTDKALLPGASLDAIKFVSKGRAFVLSSDYEGMPNALMEAMASGVPCVSTRCKMGPEELIADGENGLLVETNSSKQIAEALLKILDDDALAKRLSAGGKELLHTHSIDAVADKWLEYLSEVAQG